MLACDGGTFLSTNHPWQVTLRTALLPHKIFCRNCNFTCQRISSVISLRLCCAVQHTNYSDLVEAECMIEACSVISSDPRMCHSFTLTRCVHFLFRNEQPSRMPISNTHSLAKWPKIWMIFQLIVHLIERLPVCQLQVVLFRQPIICNVSVCRASLKKKKDLRSKCFPGYDVFRNLLDSLF